MITSFVSPESNQTVDYITQQYEIGLYVAVYINNTINEQFATDKSELSFHKKLRKELIKHNITLLDKSSQINKN